MNQKEINAYKDIVVSRRRWLHQHPELSFCEYNTTEFIVDTLSSFPGIQVEQPTRTGVVGILTGNKGPGRVIAFRADIDALEIDEKNELPYKSEFKGIMHACGHDGHTAMLLTAAQILSQERDNLYGEIRFIFQHAEELPPGGAVEMWEKGVMDGVDEIFGLHLSSLYPTGMFGIKSGILTSATDMATITITGKGGHSAMPEKCVDPVIAGAQVIIGLQTIISRMLHPHAIAVISIGKVEAGASYNVIPDEMKIICSIRTFKPEVRTFIESSMRKIVDGICRSYSAAGTVEYHRGYDYVVNDESLTEEAEKILKLHFGERLLLSIDVQTPGEDFSALAKDCPGFFVELGTANHEKGTDQPHHQGCYLMDEDALIYGVGYTVCIAENRLQKK
jgi:amidohydrolase